MMIRPDDGNGTGGDRRPGAPENPVFVPISLRALVVGQLPPGAGFADLSDKFTMLPENPLGIWVPRQFSQAEEMAKGVHLHWSLPDALTHGRYDSKTGRTVYPPLPDRWLIIRLWTEADGRGQAIHSRSWFVESNARLKTGLPRTAFPSDALSNHFSPSWPHLSDPEQPWRIVGRRYPVNLNPDPADGYLPSLTVLEHGDPAYTANYHACRNIFAFHDDLTDASGAALKNVSLSYVVGGWHADPAQDPLAAFKSLEEAAEKLGWRLPETPSRPVRTVCHSLLSGLNWADDATDYSQGIPHHLPRPELAVGNSSAEALAVLAARLNPDEPAAERLTQYLLAGLHDFVDKPDLLAKAEREIHRRRFAEHSPFRRLEIRPSSRPSMGTEIPKPDDRLTARLAELNDLFQTVFELQTDLGSLQEEVYDLWYRRQLILGKSEDERTLVEDEFLGETRERIQALKMPVRDARLRLLTARRLARHLENELKRLAKPSFEMADIGIQRYWEPNNPVVLISGVPRNYGHGADGRFSADGRLKIRDRLISSITVQSAAGLPQATELSAGELLMTEEGLPELGRKLAGEGVLLSRGFSPVIAARLWRKSGGSPENMPGGLTANIRLLQTAYLPALAEGGPGSSDCAAAAGFDADFPEKIAIEVWSQPWHPLYLEWEVEFHPDAAVLGKHPELSNWKKRGGDFVFTGKDFSSPEPLTAMGRSILTPQAALNLSEAMKEALGQGRGTEDLMVLSQSLGDFNGRLLMRRSGLQFPIMGFGDENNSELTRLTARLLRNYQPEHPLFDRPFAPVRAGLLQLKTVWIIDSFGQFQKMDAAPGCLVSESLRRDRQLFQKKITLPPRLALPARLKFEWLRSAAGGQVAGWLLVNRMDNGLTIFDPDGRHRGGLQRILHGPEPVVWKTVPAEGGGTSPLPGDLDPDLRNFLDGLLKASASDEKVFSSFLNRLDRALGRANPALSGGHENQGRLLGRPVALVRCRVGLELLYPAPSYKSMFPDLTPPSADSGFQADPTRLTVQVEVGSPALNSDGVLGFFIDRDYRLMHTPEPGDEEAGVYFSGRNSVDLRPGRPPRPRELTILMDPLGEITLDSGLLPVKTSRLDQAETAEGLANLYHCLMTAPVLIMPDVFRLPFPEMEGRQWSWLGFNESGGFEEIIQPVKTDGLAVFPGAPIQAREGWLRLRRAKF